MTPQLLHRRHFGVDEARSLLTQIRARVDELARLKRSLDERGYNIYRHQFFGGPGPNGQPLHPEERRLVRILEELETQGIQVKGLETGLIDFPHLRENGEEVYLCWLLGEEDIDFWHSIEAGFAGRRPIAEL